jgi:type VI secretion system protein ImpM
VSQPDPAAGFFGKVTTHGDFVSRRLPDAFVGVWDNWLQEGLHRSRAQLGPDWLNTYLSSPVWRFALASYVCDSNAWAGVLMPSVDRVGRHFPLTIAAGVAGAGPVLDWLGSAKDWYDRLEALALSTLSEGFVLDEFDLALRAIPALPALNSGDSGIAKGTCLPIAGVDQIGAAMPAITHRIAQLALQGHSVWWTDGSPQLQPSLLVCQGLPAQVPFSAMLDGKWQQWGWQLRAPLA